MMIVAYYPCMPIGVIRLPPKNVGPRYEELVESIRQEGMRNPLMAVTRVANGRIQVGPGKQRIHAAIDAGCVTVPVILWTTNEEEASRVVSPSALSMRCTTPAEVEVHFDSNYFVDIDNWNREVLTIRKKKFWRDE